MQKNTWSINANPQIATFAEGQQILKKRFSLQICRFAICGPSTFGTNSRGKVAYMHQLPSSVIHENPLHPSSVLHEQNLLTDTLTHSLSVFLFGEIRQISEAEENCSRRLFKSSRSLLKTGVGAAVTCSPSSPPYFPADQWIFYFI